MRYGLAPKISPNLREADSEFQGRKMRDFLWAETKLWLQKDEPAFCADPLLCGDLAAELASVKYHLESSGCIVVESKDQMRGRLGHSPDLADALNLSFYTPPTLQQAGVW